MFGEELSYDTISALDLVLSIDREKIEISDLTQLRMEIEYLYDVSKMNVFRGGMQLSINEEEVDFCGRIQSAYNLFMKDYENIIDNQNK